MSGSVIDFMIHICDMPPELHECGAASMARGKREQQGNAWLDLLMARRHGDPWAAWIGDRRAHMPHIRIPTPEEQAREARGGLEAPWTRVGLVYAGRLRAHMRVREVLKHAHGTFLVLDQWSRFLPVTIAQDIPWFSGWRECTFVQKDLVVSERWAVAGLEPALAERVKALLALPPLVREKEKPTGDPAEQQADDATWPGAPVRSNEPVKQEDRKLQSQAPVAPVASSAPGRGAKQLAKKQPAQQQPPATNDKQRSLW